MKIVNIIAIITVIVVILIAVFGFTFSQSDKISRHDVRLTNVEKNFEKVEDMRDDILDIKITLAEMAVMMKKGN